MRPEARPGVPILSWRSMSLDPVHAAAEDLASDVEHEEAELKISASAYLDQIRDVIDYTNRVWSQSDSTPE